MSRRPWVMLMVVLGACGDEVTRDPRITPLDGRPDDLPEEVARQVAALDPNVDFDQDGLVDADELAGWRIRVNSSGREQGIVERWVSSAPDVADTDGDGLLDGVERMVGADPDATDTDGDGLGDYEEVERWGTSPATVDSDEDARGKSPDPSAAPDVTLFDGAELKLGPNPDDPDGPLVPAFDATNPLQGDTDGDGVWDYDENATPTRSSVIADLPELRISATKDATLGLWLELTSTDESATTKEIGKQVSFGADTSGKTYSSVATTLASWTSAALQVGAVVNIGISTEQVGADAGVHIREEAGFGTSSEIATEFGMSGTFATDFNQTLSEVESEVATRTQTITGGRVVMQIDIENVGPVACKVDNLSIILGFRDARAGGVIRPVAELRRADEADNDLVLAIGEVVPLQLVANDVATDRMMALMADPSRIVTLPANYDVTTAGDEDYEFVEAAVHDRTTTLTIDDGGSLERLVVAAQVFKSEGGTLLGIPVSAILDLAGITWDADPLPEGEAVGLQEYVFKIADKTTELHQGEAPPLGDPRPYPAGRDPGPRMIKRGWYTMIERTSGVIDFDDRLVSAHLRPGDRATLLMLEDLDRDGLPALEESVRGTSDATVDSDGDGLSDWWEVKVGWDVTVVGAPTRPQLSDPARADADGDGMDDSDELAAGTDPWRADSDGDLLDDAAEVDDPDDGRDPLRFEDTVAPVIACNTALRGDFAAYDFTVTDASQNLVGVRVVWADGRVTRVPLVRTGEWKGRLVYPGLVDHAEAWDAFGNESTIVCATPQD